MLMDVSRLARFRCTPVRLHVACRVKDADGGVGEDSWMSRVDLPALTCETVIQRRGRRGNLARTEKIEESQGERR